MAPPVTGPFSLSTPAQPLALPRWFVSGVERVSGLAEMNRLYALHAHTRPAEPQPFLALTLEVLRVRVQVSSTELARIPQQGSVVVIANHPFGGLEGMLLGHVLLPVRPDVKIMANFLLQRIPALRDLFLFVDPFGSAESSRANIEGLRATVRWLKAGHLLGIFPAGEVAHFNLRMGRVVEPLWSENTARLIRRTGATVVPVAFVGRNRWLFHLAGVVHPLLRTAMLPRELLNKRHQTITMRIGEAIAPDALQAFSSDRALIDYLRRYTLGLVAGCGGVEG